MCLFQILYFLIRAPKNNLGFKLASPLPLEEAVEGARVYFVRSSR